MTQDDEIQALMTQFRSWHRQQLAQYRLDLPDREFNLVRKALTKLWQRIHKHDQDCDLLGIRGIIMETKYFIVPWDVVVWYTLNKKKK